ncbi:MAG: ABC transporter ATP-binding protein [Desulfobacterota bacterium]|jgi:branched-chain amino acid transport system ATP-binding protein|nr:ABC transporter ATP-binding protein [Thermodesulfobacteriota bacterium]
MFLEVKVIDTFYGIFQAIFAVSLNLGQGEVVSLLGRNGAGKSTSLKSIVGLCRPCAGSVRFKGTEIRGRKPFQIARMGIGFVPENRWIFSELTVRENLELGLRKWDRQAMSASLGKVYGLFPKLKTMDNRIAGTLSGGEQQMLTVGRTLMGSPECVLLDEPTAGLAPIVAQLLGDQIRKLKDQQYTLLMAEQNALFAMDISDRAYVIDKGAIVYEGRVDDLKQNRDMMREYLGV